jgi:hypothetical protein
MLDETDPAPVRASLLHRLRHGAAAVGSGIVDLALPPQCLACDRHVAGMGGLCAGAGATSA